MKLIQYLTELFYPSTCVYCSTSISDQHSIFCSDCLMMTVFTNFQNGWDNEMTQRLISIGQLKNAYAPIFFRKESPIAGLFYKIKYGNRPDLAQRFGVYLVHCFKDLKKCGSDIDVITFVPIHPLKKAKRGYNQSEIIASSMGNELDIPCIPLLSRINNIDTQTHFGRIDRLKNQEGSIQCDAKIIQYKHVLIVDDILTTGATIETCSDAIEKVNPKVCISVATLAQADNW
ncbi:MAG: ComF family protein [Saprospiraceae bacterium]|nr:ComF family protein [Saprospiraceae bacterium]